MCGLGRIFGFIGGGPVAAAMSQQPGSITGSYSSGLGIDTSGQSTGGQNQNKKQDCQNGQATMNNKKTEAAKTDLSNGFETRPPQERPSSRMKNVIVSSANNETVQTRQPTSAIGNSCQNASQENSKERSTPVPVLVPHPPYHDNIMIDRVQYVTAQTAPQAIPVVHSSQYAPEYVVAAPPESIPYQQMHGSMYNPGIISQNQSPYVSREPSYRDNALYVQNIAINTQGTYVQQPPQAPPPNAQPPPYYPAKAIGIPQQVPSGYVHYAPQTQFHYSQYPQTVISTSPYGGQKSMYPPQYTQQQQQTSSTKQSPNPQRYSQELSQYQAQPIIQPIAQNVAHTMNLGMNQERSSSRGPKPMVPPRGNSKITHDAGHRKSSSMDCQLSSQKQVSSSMNDTDNEDSVTQDLPEHHIPRTRQDGLYVETNGDSRELLVTNDSTTNSESGYVTKIDRKKPISNDVASSFQKRSDTITFTFPYDGKLQQEQMMMSLRKPVNSVSVADGNTENINNIPSLKSVIRPPLYTYLFNN